MLTARDRVSDRVSGFQHGADDYLAKPFDAEELVARVRALLRRSVLRTQAERLHVGDLTLDPVTREVWRAARRIALTQREFALLEYLMRNTARPLSRVAIAAHVWKQTLGDADTTNIVDVYVAYLRKKLEVGDEPSMLHTVRGVGYVLREP
jgi:two-component system response regulator MprA